MIASFSKELDHIHIGANQKKSRSTREKREEDMGYRDRADEISTPRRGRKSRLVMMDGHGGSMTHGDDRRKRGNEMMCTL